LENRQIAIEEGLSHLNEFLRTKGYQVVSLDHNTQQVAAIVVGGGHKDLLADQRIKIDAPVINAEGLTPEQVAMEIERFVRH